MPETSFCTAELVSCDSSFMSDNVGRLLCYVMSNATIPCLVLEGNESLVQWEMAAA